MAVFTSIGTAVATSIFGAAAAGTIGFTFVAGLTAGALQIAAGIGLSLIGQALAGQPSGPKFGVKGQIQGGDDVPRSILFGRACTAGSIVYANAWGNRDGVPNSYLTQVVALADYPITSLDRIFVDGNNATLNKGNLNPQFGWPVTEFFKNGRNHLWVKFYDGNQTVVDPFLVDRVSTEERPYTSDRIGRGISYAIVTSLAHERQDGEEEPLFRGIPKVKFEVTGSKLYNPAQDSTKPGGSGSHRENDPSTWGGIGDHNPVVQIYTLLRGLRYNGNWLYGAQSMPAARLPLGNWIAAINKANQLQITIPGDGVGRLYRSGGEIQVGAQIKEALESLLTTCQGRLTETGGIYKIHIGEPGSPVMSFIDDDIISTEEQSFVPFFGLEDTINGVSAKYPNPAEGWNTKTAPPLIRTDLEAEVGNRRLMANVSLDFVPYKGQVQRLMRSALLEAQRARRHTLVLGPEYWRLEPGDIISWTSVRNGYVNKLFRIDGIADKADVNVMIDMTEVDPSDYDWNPDTDFRPVPDGNIDLITPPPLIMLGWQVLPAILYDQNGRARRPSIEVWFESALPDVDSVRIQVRVAGSTEIMFDGEIPYGTPYRTILAGQFTPNTTYEVRGIYVRRSKLQSSWSAWIGVTTFDIRFGENDIDIGNLIEDIDEVIQEYTEWSVNGTRETIERLRKNVLQDALSDAIAYTDRQQLRRELISVTDAAEAKWTEEITVQTGANSALAKRVETLTATVGQNYSELQNQILVATGPDSALAQSILTLNTKVDNNYSQLETAITVATGPDSALAQSITTLNTKVDDNYSQLETLIITSTGPDSAIAASITELRNEVFDPITGLPATNSAVQSLSAEIFTINGQITTINNSITSLTSTVGSFSANGLFRVYTQATPSGANARIALSVSATSGGNPTTASMFMDAMADGKSRVIINADQFALTYGAGTQLRVPFAVDGGNIVINAKMIGNAMTIDPFTGFFSFG